MALRIPSSFAREAKVDEDTEVDLKVEAGKLVIAPVRDKRYRLADLLAGVTRANIHDEADTGAPRRRELL